MGRRLFCLGLLLIAPGLSRAQVVGVLPSGCRVDTIGVDSTVDSLYAWVPAIEFGQSQAEHAFEVTEVRAVLAALQPIPTLGEPDRFPHYDPDPGLGSTPMDRALAVVWFQVRDDGRLAGMSVIRWSGWDVLDLGLQRAILRADSLRTLRPLPPELAGQAVDLWLGVGAWQGNAVDDVPVGRILRLGPRVRGGEHRPRLVSLGYRPHLSARAAAAGLGDRMIVEFVVDTSGRVEPNSIFFIQADRREFAEEALKALRSARYEPGRIGLCPARMRVRENLLFATGQP
jgi:TonB family protein